jgi:DNA-binding transcriptional LysR family regulator
MDRLAAMQGFVLVVDTGSFSAAARRLNVGQPAMSKLVERLGVKLLVRTTHGRSGTAAGAGAAARVHRFHQGNGARQSTDHGPQPP